MKYCLVKDGKAVVGNTSGELVAQIATITFNFNNYSIQINGKGDSRTYNKGHYNDEEFVKEAYKTVLQRLQDQGWTLYRRY